MTTTNRIIRNYDVAVSVKRMYQDRCQICSVRLETAAGPYSEAAHIRPLGAPHGGPDALSNVLCLCPNCDILLDEHALTIGSDFSIYNFWATHRALTVRAGHDIDASHVAYQSKISTAGPPNQGSV